jgi:hypothetical protein
MSLDVATSEQILCVLPRQSFVVPRRANLNQIDKVVANSSSFRSEWFPQRKALCSKFASAMRSKCDKIRHYLWL